MNDDDLNPGHHSTRLPGADYSRPALYFLTICAWHRRCLFGPLRDGQVSLSPLGKLVQECWLSIPQHFPGIAVLDFVVMPNHVHGIIQIVQRLGRSGAAPLQPSGNHPRVFAGSLGAIVRSFKSAVSLKAHRELDIHGEIWQRNYFDRILRPGQELATAQAYIRENPEKWASDRENPAAQAKRS